MSFDLCGYYPHSSAEGIGISFSSYRWGYVWTFCECVAPEVARKLEDPFANDGHSLGRDDAHALATMLRNEMAWHLDYWETPDSPEGVRAVVPYLRWVLPQFIEFLESSSGFIVW